MNKVYLLLFSFMLSACDTADSVKKTDNQPLESAQDNTQVLALVNDEPITEFQLEHAVNRTLGDSAALYADQKLYQKMLQSLIVSRSMALLAEEQLDSQETALLDEKVRSYREELLVKQYLQANTTVEPVTTEQVKNYYDNNPDEFGADLLKEFELIVSLGKLQAQDKVKMLKRFESAKDQPDWKKWAAELSEQSYSVTYKKAEAKLLLLSQPIKKLVADTSVGKVSEVHFGDQLIIVRVINQTQLPAKPLSEVSVEIRKKLAPVNMKKAVKEASKSAKEQVKVTVN
ncbi:peptidyl-prolyl cis-trans isomerase [Psychromonas aquimarina]|uniref:peptidylprolyl isomerase n=1 Tax=Psychromonas aquimarina TaxID=444919 RepID=UPI00042727C9|nr:peptidylprolyl isomerase [Psychromonas aquimarina]